MKFILHLGWLRFPRGDGKGLVYGSIYSLDLRPPPGMPVAKRGLAWDFLLKCKNPGGDDCILGWGVDPIYRFFCQDLLQFYIFDYRLLCLLIGTPRLYKF